MDWGDRSDIQNFDINVSFLKKHVVPFDQVKSTYPVIFSHVPKTAGTSVESYLARQYKMSESLHINAPDLNQLPAVLKMKKNTPRLICGHHPMHGLLYQLLPTKPLIHMTVLREPINRVVSYYNYVKGKKDHPMYTKVSDLTFEQFMEDMPSPELNNGQARRFAGQLHHLSMNNSTLLQTSISVLNECFTQVLTTESLHTQLIPMANMMDWEVPNMPRHNISPKQLKVKDLSKKQKDLITEYNQVDIALYEWLTRSKN